ncbi:MAG: patatin-like phospholipase family protein [Oscillospiraceae bacterium]
MAKRGLALGGGGAKGAYQMGAWQAFEELGIEFDVITGTSIGAANAALMCQNDWKLANGLWDTIEYNNVFGEDPREGVEQLTTPLDLVKFTVSDIMLEGTIDTSSLETLVRKYILEERVRAAPQEFGLVTVEIPSLRPRLLRKGEIPQGKLVDFIMASCSCFPIFSAKEIDGVRYIDGGYYDNLPINFTLSCGAQEIVAIDLQAVGLIREPRDEEEANILHIRPRWNLGAMFAFDKNLFAGNRMLGYQDTLKAYQKLEGGFYTFSKGESEKNLACLSGGLEEARAQIEHMLRKPVAKTLQTIDSKSSVGYLSRGDWVADPAEMLCRIAEVAGQVFSLLPTEEYRFEEYNRRLLHEYRKVARGIHKGEDGGELIRILAAMPQVVDSRRFAAQIVQLLGRQRDSDLIWRVSELLPREFIAAVYLKLLSDREQEPCPQ